MEKYYNGSYFAESVAGLVYSLSRQLNQDSDKFLWMWILGLTEMLVDRKIDFKTYQKAYRACAVEKDRFKVRTCAMSECR